MPPNEYSRNSAQAGPFPDGLIRTTFYQVRPRKDKRGFDLISDAMPFGPSVVWRAEPNQQRNRLPHSFVSNGHCG